MRLPEGIEIWFAHLWQTILHLQPFTGNGLPWWDCRFSHVWDNYARNRTVVVYKHPIPKSTAWVDYFHALFCSCLDSFVDGWFRICPYYVNVPSLKMWWCSFIFCGWKIKANQELLGKFGGPVFDDKSWIIPSRFCFVSIHRTTSTILGMFTTDIDPQPSQYPSSSDPRNAIARTTGRKLHAQNMHLVAGDGIWH